MRIHDNGRAVLMNVPEGLAELADSNGIEAASGLVQEK
jgi:hypothetical protein